MPVPGTRLLIKPLQVSARRFLIHRFVLAGVYRTCNDHKILLVDHVLTHVIFKVPFFFVYLVNISKKYY